MPSKNLDNSESENSLNKLLDEIKSISSAILSLSFILYFLGYAITNANLWRYGAHEIGLLEPTYLLSGLLFLFLSFIPLFAPVFMLLAYSTQPVEGIENFRVLRLGDPKLKEDLNANPPVHPDTPESKIWIHTPDAAIWVREIIHKAIRYVKGIAKDWIKYVFLVSYYYFLVMIFIIAVIFPAVKSEIPSIEIRFFLFVGFQLVCLVTIVSSIFNKPYKNVYHLFSKQWRWVSLISLISIVLFIRFVFPQIPAVVGGGKEQVVCLALTDATTYQSMFSKINVILNDNWTGPVTMLFEGEKTLTIHLENDRTYRISKDLIASIRYHCTGSNVP